MRPTTVLLFSILIAPPLAAQAAGGEDPTPLNETQRIRHVLSRFAFGPTPGLVARVRRQGLESWFEEQLTKDLQDPEGLRRLLAPLDALESSPGALLQEVRRLSRDLGPDRSPKAQRRLNLLRNKARMQLRDAVLFRAVYGRRQVLETMVDFLRNHFNVSVNKGNVRYYAPEYEFGVLRKYAFGSFGDLLERTAKHPAMLYYLDNYLSRRPPSKQELKAIARSVRRKTGSKSRAEEQVEIAKQRGLNENYARELLELHTLGVDNFYTQRDVIEVAKCLTGWTILTDMKKGVVSFLFRPDMHVKGPKRFLGRLIPENRKNPLAEGETVLRRLIAHKGTARFLAWKLCRYFVDDDPPDPLVKRVAAVFKKTKGDLKSVLRAIFRDPEFWNPRHFQRKFKRPFEFVVSALRVTGAEISSTRGLHRALQALSEPIYECEDPTGYYDQAEAWNDPGVMAIRWDFAMKLARNKIPGVRVPDSFFESLHPRLPQVWKNQLAVRLLPAGMGRRTEAVLDRVIRAHLAENPKAKRKVLAPLLLGLLLGSPEFQRQ